MFKLFLFIVPIMLVSCGKGDKRLKEQARKEGEAITTVENVNLAQKADSMEKDLARRHRFYQAIKGSYEGIISTSNGNFNIRITLTPSLPPLKLNRVRQLEEITTDLNNLMLNTQIVQWDAGSSNSAVGCRVSNVKPHIEKGELAISADSCPNLYLIRITDRGTNSNAETLALSILNGGINNIQSLSGQIQPSTNSNIFRFTANKIQD